MLIFAHLKFNAHFTSITEFYIDVEIFQFSNYVWTKLISHEYKINAKLRILCRMTYYLFIFRHVNQYGHTVWLF